MAITYPQNFWTTGKGLGLANAVAGSLRIDTDWAGIEITPIVQEAVFQLQKFKCKEIALDSDLITDPTTQAALTPLDMRYVILYVGMQYDGDDRFGTALNNVLEQVRDK